MPRENVKCTWCGKPFQIDPKSSARGFICPKCGQGSSLGALRNPNRHPNAILLASLMAGGAADNVSRHTAAYVTLTRTETNG